MDWDLFTIIQKVEKDTYCITDEDRQLIYLKMDQLLKYYDITKEFDDTLLRQLLSKDNYANILRLINICCYKGEVHLIKLKQIIRIQPNFLNIFIRVVIKNKIDKDIIDTLLLYSLNNNILSYIFFSDKIDNMIIKNIDLSEHRTINISTKDIDYYIKCSNDSIILDKLSDDQFSQFLSLLEGDGSHKFKDHLINKRESLDISHLFKE